MTRRLALAVGGFFAGSGASWAAPPESRPSTTLAKDRLKLAQDALASVRANISRGQFGPGERDPIAIWSRRRFESRLELATTRAGRVAAAEEHLAEMKAFDLLLEGMHKAGEIDLLAWMDGQYRWLEAQSWLELERSKA